MWAIRRTSTPLKLRGLRAAALSFSAFHPNSIPGASDANANHLENPILSPNKVLNSSSNLSSTPYILRRGLASQAENEDGPFSDLESSHKRGRKNPKSYSEPDVSDDEESTIRSSDPIMDSFEGEINEDLDKPSYTKRPPRPELFTRIISIPVKSIKETLCNLIDEGKNVNEDIVRDAVYHLRRRRMYSRALQVLEWFAANENVEFSESDYVSHLDTVARVRGLSMAEAYIKTIPDNFKTEIIYQTLLANAARDGNVRKSEEIFDFIKAHFSSSTFSCNQMLLLYKRFERRKIGGLLLEMQRENLKPNIFTYAHLVDVKGTAKDVAGMEDIVAAMEDERVEQDARFRALLAKHYIANGYKQKAEALLRDLEGARVERWMCQMLLPLYARVGRVEDVRRLWETCADETNVGEYQAAVSAWGILGDVAKAEEVFEEMARKFKRVSTAQYKSMLEVYACQKMLMKGKELTRRMAGVGVRVDASIVELLVRMYVDAGEVEKADTVMGKATLHSGIRPRFSSFLTLMEAYASKGDVHNAENLFRRMKQCDYNMGPRCFNTLLQAYANSGAHPYGIKERLIADNVVPNRTLSDLLAKVDPFKRNAVSDILD